MPLSLDFEEPSTFTVLATGAVTFDEVEALLQEMGQDPRLCCGVAVFVDGREVYSAPTTPELREIAREMGPLLDRGLGPIAILAGSTFIYGVARMFSVFAEAMGATIHAFRSEGEAHEWLSAHASPTA